MGDLCKWETAIYVNERLLLCKWETLIYVNGSPINYVNGRHYTGSSNCRFTSLYCSFYIVDCGEPRPPINGFVVNFDNTRSGYTATYRCYNGYIPRDLQTTTCTDARVWIPEPEEYNCTSTGNIYML